MNAQHTRGNGYRRSWHFLLLGLALLLAAPLHAQITFVGAGAQVVSSSSGTITPALPVGTAPGDVAVLIVAGRPSDTSEPAAPSGWTLRTSVFQNVSSTDLKIMTFYRVLTGGDTNPVITLPSVWTGSSAGMSGQIAVWRGVDTATPFDTADTTDTSNPSASFTVPAITTTTAGAMVVSAVATSDENDLGLSNAAGFTARMSGTNYDTNVGGDHAVGVADTIKATAGAVSMPTWQQNNVAPDRWAVITFALRSFASSTGTRLSMSFEETSWNGTAGEVKDDGRLWPERRLRRWCDYREYDAGDRDEPRDVPLRYSQRFRSIRRDRRQSRAEHHDTAHRDGVDLLARHAVRAPNDRVERHELRVSHR